MSNIVRLNLAGLVQNVAKNPDIIQAVMKTGLLGSSARLCANQNHFIVAELAIKFIKSGGTYSHYGLFLGFLKMYLSRNGGLTGDNVIGNLLRETNFSKVIEEFYGTGSVVNGYAGDNDANRFDITAIQHILNEDLTDKIVLYNNGSNQRHENYQVVKENERG